MMELNITFRFIEWKWWWSLRDTWV